MYGLMPNTGYAYQRILDETMALISNEGYCLSHAIDAACEKVAEELNKH